MAKSGYQNRIELLQGPLDMLILKTLQWGEQPGYGISQAIRASSAEVLQMETGSLYPALHRVGGRGGDGAACGGGAVCGFAAVWGEGH
jgi:PadR family transcriptional regulator PadR